MKKVCIVILVFIATNTFSQGKLERKIKKGKEIEIKVISNSCLYGKVDIYHFNILGTDSVLVTRTDNKFTISIIEFRELENYINEYGRKKPGITMYDLLIFNRFFGKKLYLNGVGSFEKKLIKYANNI